MARPRPSPYSTNYVGGKTGYFFALKQNKAFAQSLKAAMSGLPKKILGVYAATAVEIAVKATIRDSARASANWNLQFGSGTPSTSWDPSEYLGSVHGVGNIGEMGDKGSGPADAEKIASYKRMFYGYQPTSGYCMPTEGGYIHTKLRIGQSGAAPATAIYNPVFQPKFAAYAQNAFGPTIEAAVFSGEEGMSLQEIPVHFMPRLLKDLANDIRWARVNGVI